MALVTRQAMLDDTGPGTDGSVVNKAFVDQVYDQIDDQCHDAGSPLIKPKATTAEVVAARGTCASLDARLDVALNDDGTPKAVAGQASLSDLAAVLGAGNWVYNDNILIWAAGDSAAPTGYTLAGAGATVARTGTGLADTSTKVGPYSVKVTRAAADATLSQYLMNGTSFSASGEIIKGAIFGFGCWVKCAVANMARVEFTDGVTTTTTSFHPGDGLWHWLTPTLPHTVSNTATSLTIRGAVMNSAGDAYFSGMTATPGGQNPSAWIPCRMVVGTVNWKKAGSLSLGTILDRYMFRRPCIVQYAQLLAGTGPVGAALIVDINVWDGAAYQSMFSTKPQIADGQSAGGAAPDGTYRYRCLTASSGTTLTNATIDWDIDQIGVGTVGADLTVSVEAKQFIRPQESLLDRADF